MQSCKQSRTVLGREPNLPTSRQNQRSAPFASAGSLHHPECSAGHQSHPWVLALPLASFPGCPFLHRAPPAPRPSLHRPVPRAASCITVLASSHLHDVAKLPSTRLWTAILLLFGLLLSPSMDRRCHACCHAAFLNTASITENRQLSSSAPGCCDEGSHRLTASAASTGCERGVACISSAVAFPKLIRFAAGPRSAAFPCEPLSVSAVLTRAGWANGTGTLHPAWLHNGLRPSARTAAPATAVLRL